MLVPARMSWYWLKSTGRQAPDRSSGYGCRPSREATEAQRSAVVSRSSAARLSRLISETAA